MFLNHCRSIIFKMRVTGTKSHAAVQLKLKSMFFQDVKLEKFTIQYLNSIVSVV